MTARYASEEEARRTIARRLVGSYGDTAQARRAVDALSVIYARNVFADLNVAWGTYRNELGHTDTPGCFRCHADDMRTTSGKPLGQDCSACHELVAMEEKSPKVLTELGITR